MRKRLFSVKIEDCRVDNFTVGGNGGGGKDTSNTGVRVTHEPSGATGRATDTRSGHKNRVLAFRRMGESDTFVRWARAESARLLGQPTIDSQVEDAMAPHNLKIEEKVGGIWKELDADANDK